MKDQMVSMIKEILQGQFVTQVVDGDLLFLVTEGTICLEVKDGVALRPTIARVRRHIRTGKLFLTPTKYVEGDEAYKHRCNLVMASLASALDELNKDQPIYSWSAVCRGETVPQ